MLQGRVEEIAHYFVCRFSRAADDLGQWRAYADNGRGFAIGFDGRMLEEGFTKGAGAATSGRMSFPLTYGNDPLRQMYQQIIDKSIPFVSAVRGRDLSDDAITKYLEQLSINVSVTIVRAALFFKHQAYSNEEEHRFLEIHQAGPVSDLKFRGRPYSLIRYREFDWRSVSPEALKRIVIGPAADESVAFQFVTDCLRVFHIPSGVTTMVSEIPYRAPSRDRTQKRPAWVGLSRLAEMAGSRSSVVSVGTVKWPEQAVNFVFGPSPGSAATGVSPRTSKTSPKRWPPASPSPASACPQAAGQGVGRGLNSTR